jgi:hypothetical protein
VTDLKARTKHLLVIIAGVSLLGALHWAQASETDFTPFFDFYSDNRLSSAACGRGYTGIAGTNDLSGVVLNPASLAIPGRYQVYLEYAYKSEVPWLKEIWPDVGKLSFRTLHPSLMAGVGWQPVRHLQTGILYYSNNSYRFDQGTSQWTDESGNILGTFQTITDYRVQTIAVPMAVRYGEKLTLKMGLNLCLSRYSAKDDWGPMQGGASFNRIVPKVGVILFEGNVLSVGATYQPGFKQTITENWTGVYLITSRYDAMPFPAHIGVGACYRMKAYPFAALLDYEIIKASCDSVLVDRKDIRFGMEFGPVKKLTLRTGLFTQKDYRRPDLQWYFDPPPPAYDQTFITLGGNYQHWPIALQASVMDSHILSSGKLKQTFVHGGIRYDFR